MKIKVLIIIIIIIVNLQFNKILKMMKTIHKEIALFVISPLFLFEITIFTNKFNKKWLDWFQAQKNLCLVKSTNAEAKTFRCFACRFFLPTP